MVRGSSLVLVILVLAGCRTEPRACVKMKTLCGTEESACRNLRDDVQAQFGQGAVDTLDGCVLQANTCSEAAGCVTGSAAKATAEAAANFFNGFARSVSPASAEACVKEAKTEAEANGCRAGALGTSLEEQVSQFAEGLERSRRR